MRACVRLREARAQATVEMAVVTPVLIVLALIVYNLMVFMAATARFDRVAPDAVLAHAVSPVSDGEAAASGADAVRLQLERAMEGYAVEIEVVEETGDAESDALLSLVGAQRTYRCAMVYRPWPQGLSIAGVSMGAPLSLRHERPVTVDPWRPGVVM